MRALLCIGYGTGGRPEVNWPHMPHGPANNQYLESLCSCMAFRGLLPLNAVHHYSVIIRMTVQSAQLSTMRQLTWPRQP